MVCYTARLPVECRTGVAVPHPFGDHDPLSRNGGTVVTHNKDKIATLLQLLWHRGLSVGTLIFRVICDAIEKMYLGATAFFRERDCKVC